MLAFWDSESASHLLSFSEKQRFCVSVLPNMPKRFVTGSGTIESATSPQSKLRPRPVGRGTCCGKSKTSSSRPTFARNWPGERAVARERSARLYPRYPAESDRRSQRIRPNFSGESRHFSRSLCRRSCGSVGRSSPYLDESIEDFWARSAARPGFERLE